MLSANSRAVRIWTDAHICDRVAGVLEEVPSKETRRSHIDIELYAGAGGLALGLAAAGMPPDHLYELDPVCVETLKHNSQGAESLISGRIHRKDVSRVQWGRITERVRLLSAGPPCQPFSLGGKHHGQDDSRDGFPATLRAIRRLKPAFIIIENVHGLKRKKFRPYFDYVLRQIEVPSIAPRSGEDWTKHDSRLARRQASADYEPEYAVEWDLLNAADYGVAQARSRVIVIATRRGFPAVRLPSPTHSMATLVRDQSSGLYWKNRRLTCPNPLPRRHAAPGHKPDLKVEREPWLTVRDALVGLEDPPPSADEASTNHWLIPGARLYPPRHNGSDIDWPSKTIKAGVHGVPGGENILRYSSDGYRYYSLREMARLQGFPDEYYFKGARSRVIAQIGNAFPCPLATAVATEFRHAIALFEQAQL